MAVQTPSVQQLPAVSGSASFQSLRGSSLAVSSSSGSRLSLGERISHLNYEGMRYLITDCPTEANAGAYVDVRTII